MTPGCDSTVMMLAGGILCHVYPLASTREYRMAPEKLQRLFGAIVYNSQILGFLGVWELFLAILDNPTGFGGCSLLDIMPETFTKTMALTR